LCWLLVLLEWLAVQQILQQQSAFDCLSVLCHAVTVATVQRSRDLSVILIQGVLSLSTLRVP